MGIIEKMRLDGKKGFVTGAARGIGKCTATAFAEAGADVAIVDLDFEEAQKTAKELAEKTGRKVIAIKTDCTSPEQVEHHTSFFNDTATTEIYTLSLHDALPI